MPALYLPNGTINAAEDQLDDASFVCECLAFCCGVLVIGSVIAEWVIAHDSPAYATFLKESSYTDIGVAVGIVGEVMLGMRNNAIQSALRRKSDEKLGAAEKEAGEARKLAAEIQLLTAWRHASPEQRRQVSLGIGPDLVAGKFVWIEYEQADPEAFTYAKEMASIFADIGPHRLAFRGNHWTVGEEPVFGLTLGNWPEFDPSPFLKAFNEAGVSLVTKEGLRRPYNPPLLPDVYLFVGSRPPPDFPAQTGDDMLPGESKEAAGEARKRAEEIDSAHAELMAQLQVRSLNKEMWDAIEGLGGKLDAVTVAYETDADSNHFAFQIQGAFLAAGVKVFSSPRAPNIHSFQNLIYDPKPSGAALSEKAKMLFDVFDGLRVAIPFITVLPEDITAPPDVPAIIIGGRFLIPPQ